VLFVVPGVGYNLPNPTFTTLGEKIKAIRVSKNLSQEDVAYDLDIAIGSCSKIERNITDINFSRLEQIAKLFKMPVAEIVSFGEENKLLKEREKLKAQLQEKDRELREKGKEIISLQKKLLESIDKKKR
jgi:transcriptional regulator with XRE-family HTH domain